MVLLAKGAKDNSENTKSEIFSIGATILSAGLLKNFNGIYKKNISTVRADFVDLVNPANSKPND